MMLYHRIATLPTDSLAFPPGDGDPVYTIIASYITQLKNHETAIGVLEDRQSFIEVGDHVNIKNPPKELIILTEGFTAAPSAFKNLIELLKEDHPDALFCGILLPGQGTVDVLQHTTNDDLLRGVRGILSRINACKQVDESVSISVLTVSMSTLLFMLEITPEDTPPDHLYCLGTPLSISSDGWHTIQKICTLNTYVQTGLSWLIPTLATWTPLLGRRISDKFTPDGLVTSASYRDETLNEVPFLSLIELQRLVLQFNTVSGTLEFKNFLKRINPTFLHSIEDLTADPRALIAYLNELSSHYSIGKDDRRYSVFPSDTSVGFISSIDTWKTTPSPYQHYTFYDTTGAKLCFLVITRGLHTFHTGCSKSKLGHTQLFKILFDHPLPGL